MSIDMEIRPLGAWPGKPTPDYQRQQSRFESTFTKTMTLLRRELEHLRATKVVIEGQFTERDIRLDGWLRSDARAKGPAIILRVLASKHGPLTYPCDTFRSWEDNLRAIALALEALRTVDRYGVTKSGEQYAGWKQLPAHGTATLTAQAAIAILVARDPRSAEVSSDVAVKMQAEALKSPTVTREVYLAAAKATHPDNGGSTEAFQAVQSARAALAAHHGVVSL